MNWSKLCDYRLSVYANYCVILCASCMANKLIWFDLMLFSETPDVHSTYHMYVENSRSGIMKRSGMDVDAISDGQILPIYSVSRILLECCSF